MWLALALTACGAPMAERRAESAVGSSTESPQAQAPTAMPDATPAPAGAPAMRPGGRPSPASDEPARPRPPVLIYTAQLTMAVFDVQPGLKAVETLARELGGFLARQTNNTITVRVPAGRFHEAVDRLDKLGDVTGRDIQAEDVTQEYLDLELRIKSARAVRERLEQLLGRAAKVDESIAIERELERVMTEIERMEGRLKYLRDRAQFSTISVVFAARPKELVAKDMFKLPFPWLDQLGLGRLLELR